MLVFTLAILALFCNCQAMILIHWFSCQPTPYNIFFFNALSAEHDIQLFVSYRRASYSTHPWRKALLEDYSLRYYNIFLGIDWQSLLLPVRKRALFVVAGWDHPTTILLLSLLRALHYRYIIWTDTPCVDRPRSLLKGWLRKKWLAWILRGSFRILATGTVGVKAVVSMGAPLNRSYSFPFWLDLDLYKHSRRLATTDHKLRFVSSGRLICNLKGHDLALRSLSAAMKSYSGEWEYQIAGAGQDRESLEALAVNLGIHNHVNFLAWVEYEDLISIYTQSDFLIHPSPVHDPFPNAVLEGMAAGCVVMASDVCGSALDRIESGVNGFIHKAGDWRQLGFQMQELIDDPARRLEIGKLARVSAEAWHVSKGVSLIKSFTT